MTPKVLAFSVPAVIDPPAVWPRLAEASVTLCVPAFNAPLTVSALLPSFRAKLPRVVLNAPRLSIALVAVVRSTVPVALPVRVPAVITPAALCARLPALNVTVFVPALIGLVIESATLPSSRAKLPLKATAPRAPIALAAPSSLKSVAAVPVSEPAVIEPALCTTEPAAEARATLPLLPARPAPSPVPGVVVMVPPSARPVLPLRLTTPALPPPAAEPAKAPLPIAVNAPVVASEPAVELSVMLPAARPAPAAGAPADVVMATAVMSSVVITLTLPPALVAAPVVSMAPSVMGPLAPAVPRVTVKSPPFVMIVLPAIDSVAAPTSRCVGMLASSLYFRVTEPPPVVTVTPLLIEMLRPACRVRPAVAGLAEALTSAVMEMSLFACRMRPVVPIAATTLAALRLAGAPALSLNSVLPATASVPAAMVMFFGSSSNVPVVPFGARRSTAPAKSSDSLPEISA